MKRAFLLLLLVVILVSCSQKRELLYYQDKEIFAECTLNSQYKITIFKKGSEYEICFTEPQELSTLTFNIGNECYVSSEDGLKMDLPSDKIDGIYALCGVFELSEDEITSAVPADNGCAIYSFLKNDILYEITYDKSSLPIHAEITSSSLHYEISFDGIRLK